MEHAAVSKDGRDDVALSTKSGGTSLFAMYLDSMTALSLLGWRNVMYNTARRKLGETSHYKRTSHSLPKFCLFSVTASNNLSRCGGLILEYLSVLDGLDFLAVLRLLSRSKPFLALE